MDINSSRVLETTEGGLEKLAEVTSWRDSKLFSQAERLALEYAERITYTDQKVDDGLVDNLKRHFSDGQIVELTAAIAMENFRSKFNPPLGIEAQGFCVIPQKK
jgi:alkylhydroperoxidase family enzyme